LAGSKWVLASVSDPAQLVTTFGYHSGGSGHLANTLASIEDPGGRVAQFLVDTAGDLHAVTEVDSVQAFSAAYTDHRLVDLTDRAGGVWSYAYDYARKLASVSTPYVVADSQSQRLVTQYVAPERPLLADPGTSVGKSSTNLSPWHYQQQYGTVTAPTGEVTAFRLDRFGAPTQVQTPAQLVNLTRNQHSQVTHEYKGITLAAQYTWVGVQLRAIYDAETGDTTRFEYDSTYNLLTRQYGSGPEVVFAYDSLAQLATVEVGGGTPTEYSYTSGLRGRVSQVTDPNGHVTATKWSQSGFWNTDTVSSGTRKTSFAYDGYGRTTRTKRPDGTADTVAYDILNRVTRTAAQGGRVITNHYGVAGLDSLTDPIGQVYRWERNAIGWVTEETDPRGLSQSYAYNRRGNVTQWVNRRGETTSFAYDSIGRILSRTLADSRLTTYSYRPLGGGYWEWMAASNAESVDTLRTYGDTTYEVAVRDSGVHVFKTERNEAAKTVTLTSPSGSDPSVTYEYDARGLLDNLAVSLSSAVYETSFTYNSDGLQTGSLVGRNLSDPQNNPIAADIAHTYRPTHSMATRSVALGGSYQWSFFGATAIQDLRGRLVERQNGARDIRETFDYDSLGQLRDYKRFTSTTPCPATTPSDEFGTRCWPGTYSGQQTLQEQRTYAYDSVGNPSGTGVVVETGNRLRAMAGYAFDYDDDGNLIRKYDAADSSVFNQRLWWNSIGELDSVATTRSSVTQRVRFGYDGFGRRVRRNVDGVTTGFVYRRQQLVAELDAGGDVLRSYNYYPGVDRPHSVTLAGDTTYFFLTDGRGNVIGLVAPDGDVPNTVQYSPHGEILSDAGNLTDRFRFAGREYDAETGLYYNRARYYDPQVGRFISEDPIALSGGINPFVFAGNNPVDKKDPTGTSEQCRWVDSFEAVDRQASWTVGKTTVVYGYTELIPVTRYECEQRMDQSPDATSTGGITNGGSTPPRPGTSNPTPAPRPPSCRAVTFSGNSGTIHIQTDPASGTIAWGVVMHNPAQRGGAWTYREFVGGKPTPSNETNKVRDILHGSVNPMYAKSGETFNLAIDYIDPFGIPHRNVPHACLIP
jgi:RHS repeat-associated protein